MAVTVVQVTKIACDGTDMTCSEKNNLSYDKPQSVAARMAARLGWSIGADITCPACLTGRAL